MEPTYLPLARRQHCVPFVQATHGLEQPWTKRRQSVSQSQSRNDVQCNTCKLVRALPTLHLKAEHLVPYSLLIPLACIGSDMASLNTKRLHSYIELSDTEALVNLPNTRERRILDCFIKLYSAEARRSQQQQISQPKAASCCLALKPVELPGGKKDGKVNWFFQQQRAALISTQPCYTSCAPPRCEREVATARAIRLSPV